MEHFKLIDNNNEFSPEALREYRRKRQESQCNFWSRFGVTQSRGSRFETGAEIPPPVAILLKLYLEGVITDHDLSQDKPRFTDSFLQVGHLSM